MLEHQRVSFSIFLLPGEAINNAAGLGFNGYESDGSAKWDLVTNVNIRKLEVSSQTCL